MAKYVNTIINEKCTSMAPSNKHELRSHRNM